MKSNKHTKREISQECISKIAVVLLGLGEGLVKDDHEVRKEWFTFKKKSHGQKP
jgi:beta-lactamase class D